MSRFFTMFFAIFISVLSALATWHFAQAHLANLEAEKLAAVAGAAKSETKTAVEKLVNQIKYEWKVEERTNPVTSEKIVTATRFSEDIGSALTFRCYGLNRKQFDILVSFPKPIDWNSSQGIFSSLMKFKIDHGDLAEIGVERSTSSVAVPDLTEVKNVEKEYQAYPSLVELYGEQNRKLREFKRIGSASIFEASIPDGTIHQQTISIDLSGIEEAIKPVLSLCEKSSI